MQNKEIVIIGSVTAKEKEIAAIPEHVSVSTSCGLIAVVPY